MVFLDNQIIFVLFNLSINLRNFEVVVIDFFLTLVLFASSVLQLPSSCSSKILSFLHHLLKARTILMQELFSFGKFLLFHSDILVKPFTFCILIIDSDTVKQDLSRERNKISTTLSLLTFLQIIHRCRLGIDGWYLACATN